MENKGKKRYCKKKRYYEKKYYIDLKKTIKTLLKIGIIIVMVYVVVGRIQEVNGLSWFFTTWK